MYTFSCTIGVSAQIDSILCTAVLRYPVLTLMLAIDYRSIVLLTYIKGRRCYWLVNFKGDVEEAYM